MLQLSKGLSVKQSLMAFSGIVAVIFIIVGVIAYVSAGSFRGIVDKSTSNAVMLSYAAELGKTHDSIRGDIVTYILAFERGEAEWVDRTEKKYAVDKRSMKAAMSAIDASATRRARSAAA